MGINAHRAYENDGKISFRKNLNPYEGELEELRKARETVRETLKAAFLEWENKVSAKVLFEDTAIASFRDGEPKPKLRPKFRGQGSYVYATLNQPTQNPPQEMDFDDGMFLPTSFLSDNGGSHPVVISQGYFSLVEAALAPLCKARGWTLNPGKARPSCVRIGLNNGRSHLDIALYAIPDDEYHVLVEKAATAAQSSISILDEASIFDNVYQTIPVDQIMLAHRVEGWKVSDPRKLEDWFLGAVKSHGEQLRRICRYLKGWRDHTWEGCKLSSIALMACTVRFFDEENSDYVGRDDLAIQAIAAKLPIFLSEEIPNPVVNGRLDEGWDDGPDPCRSQFVTAARSLRHAVDVAMAQKSAREGLEALKEIFGAHFPSEESLISDDGQIEYKSASVGASAALIGITASEQAARAKSAAAALQAQNLASKPWGSTNEN